MYCLMDSMTTSGATKIPVLLVMAGIICFFATFWVQALQGLNLLMIVLGRGGYFFPAGGFNTDQPPGAIHPWPARENLVISGGGYSPYTLAVLEANALSLYSHP